MKNKILSFFIFLIFFNSFTIKYVFADSIYFDSIGSVKEDIYGENIVGIDFSQNKTSEYLELNEFGDIETNVYATKASSFSVVIPKTVILDGSTYKGEYSVMVKGDIASNEIIKVTPDDFFYFNQPGKDSILATIIQDKTSFRIGDGIVDEFNIVNGIITTGVVKIEEPISAGSWNGTFKFNINFGIDGFNIRAIDEYNCDLNVIGEFIIGTRKEELLNSLVETGEIQNIENVDYLINVKANEFEGVAIATFDVSEIANPGDLIIFYHYNEELCSWEYIGVSLVDEYGEASGYFNSFSPIALCVEENHLHEFCFTSEEIATCEFPGKTIYTCVCGEIYVEEKESLGHLYDEPVYKWNEDYSECSASRVCLRDNSHIETEIIKATNIIEKEATCTVDGIETFFVEFNNSSFSNQSITNTIEAVGHSFGSNSNGYCNRCSEFVAGLYDSSENLIVTWEQSGINVETNYIGSGSEVTAPYYVLTSKYPSTTKIILPKTVKKVGNYAFYNCSNISKVVLPDNLEIIGSYAFYCCTGLTSINIPQSVTAIGEDGFYKCSALTSFVIPDKVTRIEPNTFNNCYGLKSLTIGSSVTFIGKNSIDDCTSLTSLVIPDSVTYIANLAFHRCSALKSVTIGSGVKNIGAQAFYRCPLTSVTFKNKSGWYVGASEGAKTTSISSSNLTTSNSATYLISTYVEKYWTRS